MRESPILIELSDEQIKTVKKVLSSKKPPKTIVTRCRILLDFDKSHGKMYTCQKVDSSDKWRDTCAISS